MAYSRVNWQDGQAGGTPLSAGNLNIMDEGIKNAHDRLDAATPSATANTLMSRDANGRSKVSSPVASDDIATKGYVDGVGTNAANANTIMRRDSGGRAKVAAPVALDDIARMAEVDALDPKRRFQLSFRSGKTVQVPGSSQATILTPRIAIPPHSSLYVMGIRQTFSSGFLTLRLSMPGAPVNDPYTATWGEPDYSLANGHRLASNPGSSREVYVLGIQAHNVSTESRSVSEDDFFWIDFRYTPD